MAYKLMAVDIDGTLLNDSGELTENTKNAIRKWVDKGLIFTIASGRPIQGVEKLNKELNLDVPFITYNGAMVVMGKSKQVLYEQKLSPEDSRGIIRLGQKYNTTILIWKDNKLFVSEINDRVNKYKCISGVEPVVANDLEQVAENGVTKILWYDEVEKIHQYQKEIGALLSVNVNFHPSRPYFMEFVDKNASKAIALEKIGLYFGIKQSEMIAVGDGYNDISMIEYAGLGVAMANSPDEVKQRADYITLSNEEDGVAHVIYKFLSES
ncbi:MAG: HAD family phosphatase [Clostridiaceae bacterium]|nr:HAD family phosphatase [Clostridiaceae bacterium]